MFYIFNAAKWRHFMKFRYEYRLSREYNWNVKNKASKGYEENYYLVFRGDAVYYNELETRFDIAFALIFSQDHELFVVNLLLEISF